jgi:hypothetical protein
MIMVQFNFLQEKSMKKILFAVLLFLAACNEEGFQATQPTLAPLNDPEVTMLKDPNKLNNVVIATSTFSEGTYNSFQFFHQENAGYLIMMPKKDNWFPHTFISQWVIHVWGQKQLENAETIILRDKATKTEIKTRFNNCATALCTTTIVDFPHYSECRGKSYSPTPGDHEIVVKY